MTPKRRGPQKKKRQVVRIRYVEDERRKGGSLEQMIYHVIYRAGRTSECAQDRGEKENEGRHAGRAATRSGLKEQGQRTRWWPRPPTPTPQPAVAKNTTSTPNTAKRALRRRR